MDERDSTSSSRSRTSAARPLDGPGLDDGVLAELVSAIGVGLYVWELENPDDPAGMRLVYANPASVAVTGLAIDAVVGRTMRDAFPTTPDARIAIYAEVALGCAARSLGDVASIDAGTDDRTFSVGVFPLGHRRVGIAFNDVTRERTAEARALEVLDTMSDACTIFDREWRYTYINKASEQYGGVSREEKLGRCIWEVYPVLIGSPAYEAYHRAVRDNVTVVFEAYFETVGKWCAVRAYPGPNGLTVYYQDITDQKRLEAELLQSQKLEAMGQLASGVAHDFNNLLSVIDGYASLAESELDSTSSSIAQSLGEIRSAASSGAAMTAKLLAFGRKQPQENRLVDVNAVVSSALDLVDPLIGAHIAVHRRLEPGAGSAMIDRAHVQQVILNLAVNARDAMRDGGNLEIETRTVEVALDAIPGLSPGCYVSITVRDDGTGMDESTLAQIFNPFFTTKPVGEGTGLGLSTAYGTITQSGGLIVAASTPGEGTTFTIYLPRSTSEERVPEPATARTSTGRGTERILVIEDNEAVRALIVMVLTRNGYDVAEAWSAGTAADLYKRERFDLLITDNVFPGGSGLAVAREAVGLQPHLPVIFMSGNPVPSHDIEIEGSTTAFVPKPFRFEELTDKVRDILDEMPA